MVLLYLSKRTLRNVKNVRTHGWLVPQIHFHYKFVEEKSPLSHTYSMTTNTALQALKRTRNGKADGPFYLPVDFKGPEKESKLPASPRGSSGDWEPHPSKKRTTENLTAKTPVVPRTSGYRGHPSALSWTSPGSRTTEARVVANSEIVKNEKIFIENSKDGGSANGEPMETSAEPESRTLKRHLNSDEEPTASTCGDSDNTGYKIPEAEISDKIDYKTVNLLSPPTN